MSASSDPRTCDLAAALKRMGNNVELLKKIVEFFREDSGRIVDALRRAIAAGDSAEVQQAAHSLRGLIANFSAEAATHVALQLELMAQSGDLAAAPERLGELEQELSRLDASITAGLPKLEHTAN